MEWCSWCKERKGLILDPWKWPRWLEGKLLCSVCRKVVQQLIDQDKKVRAARRQQRKVERAALATSRLPLEDT